MSARQKPSTKGILQHCENTDGQWVASLTFLAFLAFFLSFFPAFFFAAGSSTSCQTQAAPEVLSSHESVHTR